MRVTMCGSLKSSAAVVVGTWNPLLDGHEALIARLRTRASGEAVVAVLLDPPPAALISSEYPIFEDARTRLERLQGYAVDAVAHVAFSREDVALGLLELLEAVRAQVPVSRLWVGHGQQFGPGDRGNSSALIRAVARYRILIDRLPPDPLKERGRQVLAALGAGRVAEAAALAGRRPVVRRDALWGGERLAWAPGAYTAVPVATPTMSALDTAALDTTRAAVVRLTVGAGGRVLPIDDSSADADAPYLAFVSGPGDATTGSVVPRHGPAAVAEAA